MNTKKALLSVMLTLLFSVSAFAGSNPTANFMTLQDLAKYNGVNNPAYIAVDNRVYDISNLAEYKNGTNKELKAGRLVSKTTIDMNLIKACPFVGRIIKVFTIEEVAKFDGKNGKPLYAVVSDNVYDNTPGVKSNGRLIGKIITPAN